MRKTLYDYQALSNYKQHRRRRTYVAWLGFSDVCLWIFFCCRFVFI